MGISWSGTTSPASAGTSSIPATSSEFELSGDGQLVAFLRRSIVQSSDVDWREQSASWVVDLSGENPRELVSADTLRDLLGASETDSTNIPEMAWIPGTHRLLYNGWTYLVMAEGSLHAIPRGLYSVDADEGTQQVLVKAESILRFVVSPDGRQVALLSPTALAFVDADGSNLRPDVLTYAQVGVPGPLFPVGVWTEDSQAFVMTKPLEGNPAADIDFAILRVPADGSAPDELASVSRSHPGSVTFSPDGMSAAYIQYTDEVPPEIAGWFITPLGEGEGRWRFRGNSNPGTQAFTGRPTARHLQGLWLSSAPVPPRTVKYASRRFPGVEPLPSNGSTQPTCCCSPATRRRCSSSPWIPLARWTPTTEPIETWPLEDFVGPQSFAAVEAGDRMSPFRPCRQNVPVDDSDALTTV